jgi:hypothetical protein
MAVLLTTVVLFALGAGSSAAASCPGRQLLQCGEIQAVYADYVNWLEGFTLDSELEEVSPPVGLGNPSLRKFWTFEASTAGARASLEFELGNEVTDQDFEQIPQRLVLPKPRILPRGTVDHRLANAMSGLMLAEQAEVVNLEAVVSAMNRASAAAYLRTRRDWVAWQESAAAGFARQAAVAVGRVIRAERTVSRLLVKRRLLFGVGSEDLALTKRKVRREGLASSLKATMLSLGLQPGLITYCQNAILNSNLGTLSFSLARNLAAASVIGGQQKLAAGLRHFAGRIPLVSGPPA